jgi:predicted nucleotidyltransferase component of viral defense system
LIDKREVMEFSREFGLDANVVEKDYVIGWVLAGIYSHPDLASSWVFKGGTCLKKCYFETYRFSEDLDFTVTNPEHLNKEFLVSPFNEISEWIYEATGIEIPKDTIRFELYENPRGEISAEGRIGYRGPMQRRGDPPRIKLDLTVDEVLVLDSAVREVHHPYSDRPDEGIHIQCYRFEEVFAEKFRALAERERPRDLYDVVHLFRHQELRPNRALILRTLEEKCAFKGLSVPTMDSLENRPERAELESEWENMLAHQLPTLPPFEQFWREVPEVLEWLYGRVERVVQPAIPRLGRAVDEAWRPPAMAQAWYTETPLEVIRSAAANRLCVDLTYQDRSRLIEPYSLRRTREGNLLLYAVRHESGEIRSYRVDRIQGAQATRVPFIPRYVIELTPSGPISAPQTTPRSTDLALLGPRTRRTTRRSSVSGARRFGPKYVFKCSLCGKRFTRKSYNASLNPHKDKRGYPCPGRIGVHVTTRY